MFTVLRSLVASTAVLCVVLLGAVSTASAVHLPEPLKETTSQLPSSLQSLLEDKVVTDGTLADDEKSYLDMPPGALIVVTPGTEDLNLSIRLEKLLGNHPVAIVEYDESFWPVMSGKSGAWLPIFAPTFDASRRQAVAQNLKVMRVLQGEDAPTGVLYTGYSQGAVALGDAVEAAALEGLLGEKDHIYLTSDGRGPWGILPGLQKMPFMSLALLALGVSPDGARSPVDLGDVRVTDVIVTADSIANFQWKEDRVEESIFINILGYVVCHGGPVCYGGLEQHGPPTYLESVEGNVTYEIYHSLHPVTMLYLRICNLVGVTCSKTGIAAVDWLSQAWYKIEPPTIKGAAVPVQAPSRSVSAPEWRPPVNEDEQSEESWPEEVTASAPSAEDSTPASSSDEGMDGAVNETPLPTPSETEEPATGPSKPQASPIDEQNQPDDEPLPAPPTQDLPEVVLVDEASQTPLIDAETPVNPEQAANADTATVDVESSLAETTLVTIS